MGVGYAQAKFFLDAKKNNINFSQTATVGRLFSYLNDNDITSLKTDFDGTNFSKQDVSNKYVDTFFKSFLGAEDLTAIDFSDYEGAQIIHDMNSPIGSDLHQQFDAVIDGGSLEHIFNFPVAIENCMNLVKTGGSLFICTMANNHCGHGFYQFSPELMFRIFQPENGFIIEKVVLELHPYPGGELTSDHAIYRVNDPAEVGGRVGLVTSSPTMMMVHARKIEHIKPFATYPLQSDYSTVWTDAASSDQSNSPSRSLKQRIRSKIFRSLPQKVQSYVLGHLQLRHYSIKNQTFYTRE